MAASPAPRNSISDAGRGEADESPAAAGCASCIVRALASDAEVPRWLDFVAGCFAFKGVPRSHFATHFYADPWRDARTVLVAETRDGAELVAALRVFDRRVYGADALSVPPQPS